MNSVHRFLTLSFGLAIAGLLVGGCTTGEAIGPNSQARQQTLDQRAQLALQEMTSVDPSLKQVIDSGYAYAVLPNVGEAAVGVGGAGGQGIVYQNGHRIGTVTLNQLSLGPQVGGQSYSELVVFQNQPAFQRLENGNLEWGSEASATILKTGTAAGNRFDQGVSVYLLPRSGLEVGVSLNGQKLNFHRDQQKNRENGSNDASGNGNS